MLIQPKQISRLPFTGRELLVPPWLVYLKKCIGRFIIYAIDEHWYFGSADC